MILPDVFEQQLGFLQIRELLRSHCLSAAGVNRVERISFSTDYEPLCITLAETTEFKTILEEAATFPSEHFIDASPILERLRREGDHPDETEFLRLARALWTIFDCVDFLFVHKERYPTLYQMTVRLASTTRTAEAIDEVIDEPGIVKSKASKLLSGLRRHLENENERSRHTAERLLRSFAESHWIPAGGQPTVRDDRIVLPVLAEYKRKVNGLIIDESASGQTVFMEPSELLQINNRIKELRLAERRETDRILGELASTVRSHFSELVDAFEFLGSIELVRAKALLAKQFAACRPVLVREPALDWKAARHPLLMLSRGRRPLVPLDVELKEDCRMLLLSGPNAGGKSVCLKTIGLIQYMLQCGLLVPVAGHSRFGLFRDIFVDMGDQQSIENDLSTYSSRLKNMVTFMKEAGPRSLVLLDELGSGTDPNFGGAIALAALSELVRQGAWGAATTHYYSLKVFAEESPGLRNGAMRFDEQKMEPLFILDIGKPGSSYAMEIARNTGMPDAVLAEASNLAGKELTNLERLLREVANERNHLDELLNRNAALESELKKLVDEYRKLSNELHSRRSDIIGTAREEARELLSKTNKEIERTIRHIRENRAERKETRAARRNLSELSRELVPEKPPGPPAPGLSRGDRVRIPGQAGSGVIVTIKGRRAVVQFGELISTVEVTKLERAEGEKPASPPARSNTRSIALHSDFSGTLDVRGKRAGEIGPLLDQFLDKAVLTGADEVRVLHGKGEGILRKTVCDWLERSAYVASFKDEHADRGGAGITVVVLR